MRKLKTYGGNLFIGNKQQRVIVATTSKKRAIEILPISSYEFNYYWCETGNDIECKIALENPEIMFSTDNQRMEYKVYEPTKY